MTKALSTDHSKTLANEMAAIATESNWISANHGIFTFPRPVGIDEKTKKPIRETVKPIEVCVLGFAHRRSFWKKQFRQGDTAPTDCRAIAFEEDKLVPHKSIESPINADCKSCPNDQWGTALNGGNGKACKNSVVLAFVSPLSGIGDTPFLIDLPPTSIKPWKQYLQKLFKSDDHFLSVITEIAFDASSEYKRFKFNKINTHDRTEDLMQMREMANDLLLNE